LQIKFLLARSNFSSPPHSGQKPANHNDIFLALIKGFQIHFQIIIRAVFGSVRFSSDGKIEVSGDEISISIKSTPEFGRANRELVKKLATNFRVGKAGVKIISGLTSRKKIVEIL